MAETTITYNGITLKNVLTEFIDQEVVPDSTGVNPIYVRVTVSCTGILHATSPGDPLTIGKSMGANNLADGYNFMIDQLMQPGRSFLMTVGAQALFDIVPGHVRPGFPNPNAGDTITIRKTDVNHGPIPSVRVLGINSAHAMRIHFSIVMCLPYTDVDGYTQGGAISFRFWIAEDIDGSDWTTTRTYQGVFRVRHLGHNVLTEFRNNFVLPLLVEGFQRRRIGLAQSPNGLELHFTITDQEVWAVPPFPATSWHGKQTIHSPQPGGVMMYSECYVRLKADKTTPKWELLTLAQKIMDQKLHRLDSIHNNGSFLQSFRMEDNFTDNEIEMSAVINLQPLKTMLWNFPKENFARPLNVPYEGQADNNFPTYNKDRADIVYPTACIQGLFLAALQDPLHITGFPTGNEAAQQLAYGYLNCPLVVNYPNIPENTDYISPEQKASSYQLYTQENETCANSGVIQLPLGKQSSSFGGDTAVMLRLHQNVASVTVRVEAERLNEWPVLPAGIQYSNKLGGVNFIPLNVRVTTSLPQLSADYIKTLYRSTGHYVFGQNKEALAFVAGLAPYRIQNPSQSQQPDVYYMPLTAFSDKILFA